MEGGKKMNFKMSVKIAFVIILSVILVGLIFIINDKTGKRAHIYDPLVLSDYVIENETKKCDDGEEFLYEDDNYKYYLPCKSSYDIYLQWDDGARDLVKDALNNKKVNIDSLTEHGLKVIKHAK